MHGDGFRGIGCGMDGRGWMARHGFWPLALLWLPTGVVVQAALRFGPSAVRFADAGEAMAALGSLAVTVPCGLPLALGCRRLWRLGYRRVAWAAGIGLGVLTIPATVFAGLLGPVAIAVSAAVLSLPVWFAWLWLARHG
ncbi:MAG: hypothetical protein F4114_15810 [Rhodospirillaceae bacterium]|nr:hypothetical protein [Rhodospirillaceae bacterium]MYB13362.1 hypothetical protein [Rhodospirillaceae bacterium]MYI50537.1 hypothetical protein [Rhodospirillaceae bacterium]